MMDVWRSTPPGLDMDSKKLGVITSLYYSLQVAIDMHLSKAGREVTFRSLGHLQSIFLLPFHSSHQHKHSGMYLTSGQQLH